MAFWNRGKNWEDEYDEDYARDRRSGQPRGRGKFWFVPHLLTLGLVGTLFLGAIGLISGKTMVEKLVTSLCSPLGFVWIMLILMVYFCLLTRQTWPAIVGFLCWLVITVGGNKFVSNSLIHSLEAPYESIDVFSQEPFDIVVVLGGGTNTNTAGRPQLDFGGDRVALAAELYHAGLAKKIVCTGTQKFRSTADDLHPREESKKLLIALNVPEQVVMMMQGENTSQEMSNLKGWLEENKIDGRIGLLTSAWHLGRAMRLSENNGLKVQPIPADFTTEYFSAQPGLVVPNSENMFVTARAMKEYLARLVGR